MGKLHKDYRRELWDAIREADLATIDVLLSERPSLRGLKASPTTLLHDVVTQRCKIEVIQHLVDAGLDVNAKTKGSAINALSLAATNKRPELVAYLIEKGAVIDTSASYRNPFIAAASSGDIATAKILIDAGIDPSLKYRGRDALWFAAGQRNQDMVDFIIDHQSNGNPSAAKRLRKRADKVMSHEPGWLSKLRDFIWVQFGI